MRGVPEFLTGKSRVLFGAAQGGCRDAYQLLEASLLVGSWEVQGFLQHDKALGRFSLRPGSLTRGCKRRAMCITDTCLLKRG